MPGAETTIKKVKRLQQELSTLYKIYTPTTEQMYEVNTLHVELKDYLDEIETTRAVLMVDYLEKEIKILRQWKLEIAKPRIIKPK